LHQFFPQQDLKKSSLDFPDNIQSGLFPAQLRHITPKPGDVQLGAQRKTGEQGLTEIHLPPIDCGIATGNFRTIYDDKGLIVVMCEAVAGIEFGHEFGPSLPYLLTGGKNILTG
jgi:hypothetical protein